MLVLTRRSRDKTEFLQERLPAFERLRQRKAEWDNLSGTLQATEARLAKKEAEADSLRKDVTGLRAALDRTVAKATEAESLKKAAQAEAARAEGNSPFAPC